MELSCLTKVIVGFLLIDIVCGQSTPTSCTSPPIVANSNYSVSGQNQNDIVTYSCWSGYRATGSLQKTCRDGRWVASGAELVCTALYCPRPPYVSRGSYRSLSRYTVGSVVTYNCYSGYMISNDTGAEIICQENQTWTRPIPLCQKKDCGLPQNITGANITFTTTDYYSTALYQCREGYDLYSNGYMQRSGRYTVRCLSSGFWATTPMCKPKDCGLPSNIYNGVRYTQGNHLYGQNVTYECNHGYELLGNNTVTCLATGRWSLLPTCKRVQCNPPPKIANASTHTISKVFYGNSTRYYCDKGFEMYGTGIVSCRADGMWTQLPTCSLVDCRTPPAISFGIHSWTTTTYKSEAEYTCDAGYNLIGVPNIHCTPTGMWSEAPSCVLSAGSEPDKSAQVSVKNESSSITALAIACALFGVITLLCLIVLVYKLFIADRTSKLFSYASYKNGEDNINTT